MAWTLVIISVAAFLAPAVCRRIPNAGWVLAIVPAVALIAAVSVLQDGTAVEALPFPTLAGSQAFLFGDGLTLLFSVLISGLGILVVIYSAGYLQGDPYIGRYYLLLLLFHAAMLVVVWAGDLLTLYVGWELTSVASFLLIGCHHGKPGVAEGARRALLVTSGGGLAMLAGFILLAQAAGTTSITEIVANSQLADHPHFPWFLTLIAIGAFAKSAQFPLHFWLPEAMVAPTPVSAYLHAATMVKAGVYLLARLHPAFGDTALWYYLLETVGAVTMVFGGALAVIQTDLKKILAYSTISVLGMLILLLGIGTETAVKAAMTYLVVHALYKGALFFVAGAIDHATGTRDIRELGRLLPRMPFTGAAAILGGLSMAGIPPLAGYISKELLYEAQTNAPHAAPYITFAGVLGAMLFTAAAGLVVIRPFFGKCGEVWSTAREVRLRMLFGPVLLGALGLILGMAPSLIDASLIGPAVTAVQGVPTQIKIELWHGFNPLLLLSLAGVLLGVVVYLSRRPLRRLAAKLWPVTRIGPASAYEQSTRLLHVIADKTTHLLQNGSLRSYVLMTLSFFIVLAAYPLLSQRIGLPSSEPIFNAFSYFLAAAYLILFAALAAGSRRFASIVALSGVGFLLALFFGIYSGFDVSIVQLAVETLSILLIVFLLQEIPQPPHPEPRLRLFFDIGFSAIAASTVTAAYLVAVEAGSGVSPLAHYFLEATPRVAHGTNVVNTILTDFRALDTIIEMCVLVAATIAFSLLHPRPDKRRR